MIVDDQKLFADVIHSVLEEAGMRVVGTARTGEEAEEFCRRERPDVVLMDLSLPDDNGVSIGKRILEKQPETVVIALTAMRHPRAVADALRAGFRGYISKDTPLSQFVRLIGTAVDGQAVIPHRVAAAVAGFPSQEERSAVFLAEQLSKREREVLTLLVEGASSSAMARALQVSPNTVRTHVQSILTKLQVHSRLEAATFAVKYGLIQAPGGRRIYS